MEIIMTNYLIMRGGTPEHYFYNQHDGICMKKRSPSGIWQTATSVFSGGKDGFGIYCGKDKNVHLICTDYDGKLVYAVSQDGEWKKYVISKLNSDISVSDMRLYSIRGRLNLMYSALYNGENLLVHCILGDHAKPSTIDTLETPHFFIKGNKVYYTNANGVLGFVNISDEKPVGFHPLYDDAHFGTVYNIGGNEKILFSRNSAVFLDGEEIAHDSHIEMPILVNAHGKTYIMWKNSGFVRYVLSLDGESFSKPMRFMNTGRTMNIYTLQIENESAMYYGYDTQRETVLLGNPDIFGKPTTDKTELERVQSMLNQAQKDVIDAKKEIARLEKVLSSLTDRK
ncbi:MAG: hypothetical protein IJQ28_06005 [Clostridia bacterium]|nr:hypothetical protein [Clostridia bacterium]